VHYIPASISNVTEVVEYVLNVKHEHEMQQVVRRANEWCKSSMTADALASAAVKTLENYLDMLYTYDSSWNDKLSNNFVPNGDLVPCNAG
jgi:tRNA 2-selenouridine synthase SelU